MEVTAQAPKKRGRPPKEGNTSQEAPEVKEVVETTSQEAPEVKNYGNKVDLLPEGHPFSKWELPKNDNGQLYHVYLKPWKNKRTGADNGEPYVANFHQLAWRKRKKHFENGEFFEEIMVLHDPTFKP